MKLHYAEVLNPRKVCALAKHIEAPVDYVRVALAAGEHMTRDYRARLNPNAKVPVLEDGERIIWESDAIMCHLARRQGSDLWPQDERQVDVLRWLSWNAAHFQPQGGVLYFEHVARRTFGLGPPRAEAVATATKGFRKHAAVLERHLEGRETLVGAGWTIADFSVACVLPFADEAELPLDDFPAIRAYAARLDALPAWRAPYPSRSH